MSGRGPRVPAPAVRDQRDLRFADTKAAENWARLCNVAAGNCAAMHAHLSTDPRHAINPGRHHRLLGELGSGRHGGREMEQWQYEITGSGRVWFLIDDERHRVWLTLVVQGHPSETDK